MAFISSPVVKKLYISSEIHIFNFILWKLSHSTTKPNKSRASSKDSDQPGLPLSLISPPCPHEETFGP